MSEQPNGHQVEEMSPAAAPSQELPEVATTAADRVAYVFYGLAALAALVGQVWAAVEHIPWPKGEAALDGWVKVLLVIPAVAVIELGGVATSGLADARRRKNEKAYAYRTMSAFAALVAIAFNIVGHKDELYLAIGFGGLSAFAYALWLAHSGARRRDALRKAGQLDRTPPVYGWSQWRREPAVTQLARTLALRHGWGVQESLERARKQIKTEERRRAIAAVVAQIIEAEHKNPLHAKIAVTTYDLDALAEQIEAQANYAGWAQKIGQALAPERDPDGNRPPVGQSGEVHRALPESESTAEDRAPVIERPALPEVKSGTGHRAPVIERRALPAEESGTVSRALPEVEPTIGHTARVRVPGPRHGSGATPAQQDRALPADVARMTDAQQRQSARDIYRASVAAGAPIKGAELARMYGKTDPKWGTRRIAEVREEPQSQAVDQVAQPDPGQQVAAPAHAGPVMQEDDNR
ncbi:hypothetical protein [Micromonospora aurantiaca (nom. illeg.)]|uniref:hypothetical protein n=1 Tax=Micromonospora aurantiaca (nom. illeg.) TaxID=47850 RepID=UPI0008291F5D|nr:hypothetical protein [Micromonospora aurantiaca]SCL21170.1 hypothetical protein GA0070615_0011 [Micromonospora aurantiaca]